MGLKQTTIDFQEFSREVLIRSNYKTAILGIQIESYLKESNKKYLRIKDNFNIISGFAFKSQDYIKEGTPLIRIGDVGNDFDEENMVYLPEEYKEDFEKYLLKNKDIIVSLTGDGTLKVDYITQDDKYLLNQRVGSLRAKTNEVDTLFYFYIINYLQFVRKQFLWMSNGKSQLNISPFDFLNIKIPIIPGALRDQIVAQIEPIEQRIKILKDQYKKPQEVIDKVFTREFGFDLEKFKNLKQIKNYYLDLSLFANNKDIRQSVKFHREAGVFVLQELKKITDKKIKYFISEPIVLGVSISPSNYDKNGDYFYISMADIKTWKFETEDARLVSNEYSSNNQNKTISINDIIIARSGEGTIGKVALIDDEDLQGVFADFTMRIRLSNYNPLFAYYYFRTEYFQYLVEINKKGLGNNTNIFPSQIQEFPLIDIHLPDQQKIVDEIKAELDKQEEIKKHIEAERNKIDKIIEETIVLNN